MKLLKRDAVILRARQPFLEWVRAIPELEMYAATLEDVDEEATILLIPEMDAPEDVHVYLKDGKVALLEQELEEWCPDKTVWPRPRTAALFDEWFDLEYHSLVLDTVDEGAAKGSER